MITKQRTLFYFVGETAYKSLEDAQKADLLALMPVQTLDTAGITNDYIADWMLKNSAAIVNTLTTTPRSRAKARKANGATRKRKAKQDPALEANEKAPQ